MLTPVTSTSHGVPSEVALGVDHGLKQDSAVNLDHVQTVAKAWLTRRLGRLDEDTMGDVCRALAIATGCDEL